MTTGLPTLSIITVCYNAEAFIEATIESIDSQIWANFEHIIIDGESSDSTLTLIEKRPKPYRLIISEPDKGVYDAMNKGLEMAQGKYVLFLNAGDEFADSETLRSIFSSEIDADLIYGETVIINTDRKELGTRTKLTSRKLPENLKKEDFLNGQVVSHQSFIPKKSLCSLYDLKYKCSSDIDWQLKIINRSKTIYKSEKPIAKYLQGGISDTQLLKCWKERFWILSENFSFIQVIWQHIKFTIRFLRIGAYRKAN